MTIDGIECLVEKGEHLGSSTVSLVHAKSHHFVECVLLARFLGVVEVGVSVDERDDGLAVCGCE